MIIDLSSIGADLLHIDGICPTDASRKVMADIWFAGQRLQSSKAGWKNPLIGQIGSRPFSRPILVGKSVPCHGMAF